MIPRPHPTRIEHPRGTRASGTGRPQSRQCKGRSPGGTSSTACSTRPAWRGLRRIAAITMTGIIAAALISAPHHRRQRDL